MFFQKAVLKKFKRPNMAEDSTFHSHRHENLKSYIALTGWDL
jgi:hypothetical protein